MSGDLIRLTSFCDIHDNISSWNKCLCEGIVNFKIVVDSSTWNKYDQKLHLRTREEILQEFPEDRFKYVTEFMEDKSLFFICNTF